MGEVFGPVAFLLDFSFLRTFTVTPTTYIFTAIYLTKNAGIPLFIWHYSPQSGFFCTVLECSYEHTLTCVVSAQVEKNVDNKNSNLYQLRAKPHVLLSCFSNTTSMHTRINISPTHAHHKHTKSIELQ